MSTKEEELQLHDDEGASVNRKRCRDNETATKIEAVKWARNISVNSAAKKFRVTRSRIQEWRNQESKLIHLVNNNPSGGKRKRLDGGGRPVLHVDLDSKLADWIREKRENKQKVSRFIIRSKANELFRDTDIKLPVSTGWLEKFLKRHHFVVRCVTTTAQKPPENYAEAVAKFIVYVEERRKAVKFSQVFAMDETAVWFDCSDNRSIETKGAKDVTVVTTGHEKMRITVCLTARSDGRKLLPYVLVKNKRPIPTLINNFKGELIINFAGSVWMNNLTTEDYLHKIIAGQLFLGKRLLVWDAFASHKSERTPETKGTKQVLKDLNVEAAYKIYPGT